MNSKARRAGFTLVEVLLVVVILAILAATVIPQFTESGENAKTSSLTFNLHTLRSQIELYRLQHNGLTPDPLTRLTVKTNADGTTNVNGAYGPYIVGELPVNPVNSLNTVKQGAITSTDGTTGWIYDKATGEVAPNHEGEEP